MRWLIALGVVIVGVLVATFVAARVRSLLSRPNRQEKLRELAEPIASVSFPIVLGASVIVALGIGDPESLATLPKSVAGFVPKILVATLFFLGGGAVATLVSNAVGASVLRATGSPQPQIARLVRTIVSAVFTLLAIGQIGIDTKIVDLITTGVIGSVSLAIALLTGFGGRATASEIAAGRFLSKIVKKGDRIETAAIPGFAQPLMVHKLHGAMVEVAIPEEPDTKLFIPNTHLTASPLRVLRAGVTGPVAASKITDATTPTATPTTAHS
jgi:hypothetical protein